MTAHRRTIGLGFLALACLAFAAGTNASAKPESEAAYWHELTRLQGEDKPSALAFAEKGDDWYAARGKPAEARKAMAITLLVDLGKMDEARARTRVFMARYPKSEYLPMVQGVTGIHPRPHGPGPRP